MNVILFERSELGVPLAKSDPRAAHILTILRRALGERFDAGIVDGPMGKGWISAERDDALELDFAWGAPPASPLLDLTLLVGLPRPQTARQILYDTACLGVTRLGFFQAEKGEPSYASSTLWSSGEWRRHLVNGAAQAFDTRVPEVRHYPSLARALESAAPGNSLLALDNYEAQGPLSAALPRLNAALTLCLGPERGWSANERTALRAASAPLVHLGSRVLRSETAVVSAVAIVKASRGEA